MHCVLPCVLELTCFISHSNLISCKHVKHHSGWSNTCSSVLWIFFLISPVFLFMQGDVFLLTSNAMSYNSADTVYHRQVIFCTMIHCCIVCNKTIRPTESHALLVLYVL
jgi:hypothetical protein